MSDVKRYEYVDCWELLEAIFGLNIQQGSALWRTMAPGTEFDAWPPYQQFKKHLFSHEGGQDSLITLDFADAQATYEETGLTFSGGQRSGVKHKDCAGLEYPEYNKAMYEWCSVETFEIVMAWAREHNIDELEVKIWW